MSIKNRDDLKKSNIFSSGDKREINSDWFTEEVFMKDISSKIKSKEQNIYHVNFKNGAKTKIHQHDGSQILIATRGKGVLEIFKKTSKRKNNFSIKKTQKTSLIPGDIVYIPAKTLHTHGSADKKRLFSHIAINILAKSKRQYTTVWYESDFKSKTTHVIK